MKNKPLKHKAENTFQFQSFSERLSNINIDVIHRVGPHRRATPFESETFVEEALNKWSELNCTEDFDKLRGDIGPEVHTLPQIVLRKDVLLDIIKTQLRNLENKALDAVLDITVALARDLQFDFYPSFPEVFRLVCAHLGTQDPDTLERIFVCLSYLFKFLWRYMVRDIDLIFKLYVPLLGSQQKKYIRDFAAESFAFLLRKVSDKDKLVAMMLAYLETSPQSTDGIGRLLFEAVKGVKGQTHSCTAVVLPLVLKRLDGSACSAEFACRALQQTFTALGEHIASHPENSSGVWNCLKEVIIEAVEKHKNADKDSVSTHLENLVAVMKVWVVFRRGLLSRNNSTVHEILDSLLQLGEVSAVLTTAVLECVVALVRNGGATASPSGCVGKVLEKVYSGAFSAGTVFDFTSQVVDSSVFEKDVLCHVVRYGMSCGDRTHALTLLSEVVLHRRPMAASAEELLRDWRPLPLCNSDDTRESVALLADAVLEALSKDVADPVFWAGLVCLPHLSVWGDVAEMEKAVGRGLRELTDHLLGETPPASSIARLSFVFLQAVATATLCKFEGALANITCDALVTLLRSAPGNVCLLKAADVFLTHATKSSMPADWHPEDMLRSFYNVLECNLASPHHVVRLLTLRVLSAFKPGASFPEVRGKGEMQGEFASACYVFDVCLSAEAIPLTVQDYRARLKLLQALSSEQLSSAGVSLGAYAMAPVYYQLGTLLVNFQLLWQPAQEILASHATTDGAFWSTLVDHLTSVYDKIETAPPVASEEQDGLDGLSGDGLAGVFDEALEVSTKLDDKPDYVNHRHLLWNAAEQFVGVAERRSRDVVAFFYRFLEKELWPNMQMAPHHDIQKVEAALPADAADEAKPKLEEASVIILEEPQEDEAGGENEDEDNGENEPRDEAHHVPPRTRLKLVRSLCDHLRLLSKFSNPRAVSKHERLYETYLDLLTFRDPEVQKLAFSCILSYGQKFLTPYRENFERLLDEASFRSEVVLFNVDDAGEGAVREEHRAEVIPILMRVLYGKMHTRSGSATGGKSSFTARQSTVLRFLASCRESELGAFLDLELATLKQYLSDGIMEMVNKIRSSLDLAKVVPIRRLHGTLGTVENMLRHLGALTPGLLPTLLKLLVGVATYAGAILSQKDRVVRAVIGNTRVLRSRALTLISQFFERFDMYEFTSAEIDAVFESVVWPQLPHLAELAGKQKPNSLLNFFLTLSRNHRYFVLFAKYKYNDPSTSPLPCLISLLGNSNISPSILKLLLSIVDNILSLGEEADEDGERKRAPPLVVADCFDIEARRATANLPEKWDGGSEYGALLMLPYVSHVLLKLKAVVEVAVKTQKPLSLVELNILLRISGLLTNSLQCAELAKLFLVGFRKLHSQAYDSDQQKLSTVLNLAKVADSPDSLLGYTAILFSSLGNHQSRRLLCDIYAVVAERVPCFAVLSSFVARVNSWNKRAAEEPDYRMRLEGFKMAAPLVHGQKENPDIRIVLAVICNCTYTIRAVDDLALRDAASLALAQMGPVFRSWLSTEKDVYEKCVTSALMGEIRQGLRGKAEQSRLEFVRILSQLLRHCGEHPSLIGLSQLCCERDVELDFWENLCHIQMHRRARALTRLATALRAGEFTSLTPSAICGVLLPLSSCYLFNTSYAKHTALVDAAIDVVGALCGRLPWRHYEATLSRYLVQLQRDSEHHKMAVRLVVGILDAFHFDLSKSKGIRQKPGVAKPAEDASQAEKGAAEEGDEKADADPELEENAVDENELPHENGEVEGASDNSKDTALSEKVATAIHTAIATRLLPKLHRALNQKVRADDEHRAVKEVCPEEQEILRIPIAVAMVKLLQALPDGMLQRHLPSVLLRICEFLKSRSRDVREATRGTLVKVMSLLGAPYLKYLFSQMRAVLKRGYQVHVLTYTVHAVLSSMSSALAAGDLDACFDDIVQVCQAELFSDTAEEKEVAQIGSKVREAKATKSFAIYNILASVASTDSLSQLIPALSEVLLSTTSHKTVKKCDDCLHNIVLGLSVNKGVPIEDLLIYTHRTISENAPNLVEKPREPMPEPKLLEEKTDVYLVPQEPSRSGLPVRTNKRANAHVLVEYGLKLLHSLLKRERMVATDQKHLEMLDPFVSLLTGFLDSTYVKVLTVTLRCFGQLLRLPLPSLSRHVRKLGKALFVLLHKYAGAGMKQGQNFELLVLSFKVMTVLVRDLPMYQLSNKQLLVLLTYIEQDVYDHSRQSVAFALLKAILQRRIQAEEVHGLMEKVATMSIENEHPHIRSQCREAYLQYVLDYPMQRRMKKAVGFFTAQLDYVTEEGRLSALEMLHAYSAKFPLKTLSHYAGTLFVPIAARLVNDTSPNVRRVAAAGIRSLLEKLDEATRNSLLSVVLTWCEQQKFATRRLAAQVLGLFADVEKERFERHLPDLLPVLVAEMHPDKFEELTMEDIERTKDHIIYLYLVSLSKVAMACNLVRAPAMQESFGMLCGYAETYLLHPHAWVRLAASQFYGAVFAAYKPEEVAAACAPSTEKPSQEYLLTESPSKVRSLTEKFCNQLQPDNVLPEIAEQGIRNLVFLTKVSVRVSREGYDTVYPVDWILKKVSREAHSEVVYDPRCTVKRSNVFKFLAAVSLDLTRPELHSHLELIIVPICRELEDQSPSQNEEMKQLANEVTGVVKKAAGVEAFGAALVSLQGKLAGKKMKRKRDKALEMVRNPEAGARKKIKQQQRKKEALKRKKTIQFGKKVKKRKIS